MGDECHNRIGKDHFFACHWSSPALTNYNETLVARAVIDQNDHFFLNLSMPAGKAMLEPAEGVPGSSILTVMARNGTDFGIRLAGIPDKWFTAPAGEVQGLYFPQFTVKDANPDIGDSTITETAGYGGMAMAAACDHQIRRRYSQLALQTTSRCMRSHMMNTSSSHTRTLFRWHALRDRCPKSDGNRYLASDQYGHCA
jgi:hypothetical protein